MSDRVFSIIETEQRSDEWRLARAGRLTGSRASDAVAVLKAGGEPACRRDYRVQLVCERLVGAPQDSEFVNDDMRRGIELEPQALMAYEASRGEIVNRTGFISHNSIMAGASLDGHVGDFDGIIEAKAPRPANHLKYLRGGVLPTEHEPQIIHALWLTGAAWADFISYSPSFPDGLQLFVVRVLRDEKAIAAYEAKALAFLAEVENECEVIKTLANPSAAMREAVA